MKIASYNISGGFYEDDSSKDFFDKNKHNNIDNKLLNDIISIISNENIDVICLQEVITTPEVKYLESIIKNTNLKYECHFELSSCHTIEDTMCGIAVLSKFPVKNIVKKKFTNPNLSKTTSSGNTYYTYDKGLIIVETGDVNILTHHGFPFRRFNSSSLDNKNIFYEFDNFIKIYKPDFITGDFNCENFLDLMNYTNNNYKKTINGFTTIDNYRFDNILINKNLGYKSKIIKSLSDHYIVITEVDNYGKF